MYIYINVSECDDSIRYNALSDQIDTDVRIEGSGKFQTMLELSNLLKLMFGYSLSGTRTRTALASIAAPPAQSPAP